MRAAQFKFPHSQVAAVRQTMQQWIERAGADGSPAAPGSVASCSGFRTLKFWTDPDGDFGLTLAELAGQQDGRFRRVLPRFGDSR